MKTRPTLSDLCIHHVINNILLINGFLMKCILALILLLCIHLSFVASAFNILRFTWQWHFSAMLASLFFKTKHQLNPLISHFLWSWNRKASYSDPTLMWEIFCVHTSVMNFDNFGRKRNVFKVRNHGNMARISLEPHWYSHVDQKGIPRVNRTESKA